MRAGLWRRAGSGPRSRAPGEAEGQGRGQAARSPPDSPWAGAEKSLRPARPAWACARRQPNLVSIRAPRAADQPPFRRGSRGRV